LFTSCQVSANGLSIQIRILVKEQQLAYSLWLSEHRKWLIITQRSAGTGRTFQVQAGFGFLPEKSGGFRVNPPDNLMVPGTRAFSGGRVG